MPLGRQPRIAIVHDWLLTCYGGSEQVAFEIAAIFPSADIFAMFADTSHPNHPLSRRKVTASFLQRFPRVKHYYRHLLPLMPLAAESLDLSGYDLVLTSSHAVAKGVITGPSQLNICYCHSPIRYAWDLQEQYLNGSRLRGLRRLLALAILHYIRMWDLRTIPSVDHFIANSRFVGRRIEKLYRRSATVIHPPVHVENFSTCPKKEDYYVVASRLVPYKQVGLIIKAFRELPDKMLIVIGDGPLMKSMRREVPPNVFLLGHRPLEEMRDYLQRARALINASEEDFGMSMIEAQACGTPVITFKGGGALETVREGVTGTFFEDQTSASLVGAILRFESSNSHFSPEDIRKHVLQYSAQRFRQQYRHFVLERCAEQNANSALRDWAVHELRRLMATLNELHDMRPRAQLTNS